MTPTDQPQIIAVHSFIAGTGRSSLIANLGALLAARRRVAVVDLDLLTPSLHILLGLKEDDTRYWVNDYLNGVCEIEHTAHEIPRPQDGPGALFLVPASDYIREVKHSLRLQYDPEQLHSGFQELIDTLDLDLVLINVQAGLNGVTLPTIATAEALLMVMRLDRQDYQGTAVTLDVAERLDIDKLLIIANMVPAVYGRDAVEKELYETFGQPGRVISHCNDFAASSHRQIFVYEHPHGTYTTQLRRVAETLSSWNAAQTP